MQLAIGDVVRDRGDRALAAVAGLATKAEGGWWRTTHRTSNVR